MIEDTMVLVQTLLNIGVIDKNIVLNQRQSVSRLPKKLALNFIILEKGYSKLQNLVL